MILPCKTGLQLYAALLTSEDKQQVLLGMKGATRPEQLSASELRELSDTMEAFNRAFFTPKNIEQVELNFNIKSGDEEYAVYLGRFTELDLTLEALELLYDFSPSDVERVPMMIGCIYAPIVKQRFGLPESTERLAHEIAEAIKDQAEFSDIYAVYDFFVWWKEILSRGSAPSMPRLMKLYRSARRKGRPSRMIIGRSLTVSRLRQKRITRGISALLFCGGLLIALIVRWFSIITESLPRCFQRKPSR